MKTTCPKVVVFDLDETLGSFTELGMFWDALQDYFDGSLTDHDFYKIVDMFPEILRPNIVTILNYLKREKRKRTCHKVLIYTNNQGPKEWGHKIKNYLETRTGTKLFDQVVGAFKCDGKQIEPLRTTHDKTYSDLIRCCRLPKGTEVCFLDDQEHPNMMKHDMVYYIKIKPYTHDYTYKTMATRFLDSDFKTLLSEDADEKKEFIQHIISFMDEYDYRVNIKSDIECQVDKIISKKIMFHLQEFLTPEVSKSRTHKKRKQRKNKTSKKKTKL